MAATGRKTNLLRMRASAKIWGRLIVCVCCSGLLALLLLQMFRHSQEESTSHPKETLHDNIRIAASDLTEGQRQVFESEFLTRYQPALRKWCAAYQGHVPFSAEALSASNFVERIGKDSSFYEYIFVLEGMTIGIEDSQGIVSVSYLNTLQSKRNPPPTGTSPTITIPVTKKEIAQMVEQYSGEKFFDQEIRIIPAPTGSAINGRVHVDIGGEPNNFLSWKYSMEFGPDGTLVNYDKLPNRLMKH